ncbi:hypothetical protein DTO164E3_2845 [Paecilomyces variotii]|nr:hypothetical protein DTO032I3_4750 [Paecilomyces variotii]KAJ9202872.1 hypothetical protein DTO164E3_2845 [Paecilomyces variotii]KAJ9278759.1 hypothetical protein DTO021D3_4382 [Paecilomyces variotii]KAJ9289664.1 hypothetical protein DTO021C3_2735 [Paecilomyces variotii]KAJ9325050.1 hypothetical protein DTO027B3_3844 [Paecilomyces variotii]
MFIRRAKWPTIYLLPPISCFPILQTITNNCIDQSPKEHTHNHTIGFYNPDRNISLSPCPRNLHLMSTPSPTAKLCFALISGEL